MEADISEYELSRKIYLNVISIISFGISMLFLCTHLIVFSITEDMRNVIERNLASFCVSSLFGYCTFVGGIVLQKQTISCTVSAILTYYFLLTHSSWLLSISFELWRNDGDSSRRKRFWKFIAYSLFSWLEPAAVVGVALYAEFANNPFADDFRPSFSTGTCRFGKREAFLLFFAAPFSLNLGLNLVFLCMARRTSTQQRNVQIRLYKKFNAIVAVAWVAGLTSMYQNNEVLWIVFLVLNTIQALYIFLIFTFNNQISTLVFPQESKELKTLGVKNDDEMCAEHQTIPKISISSDV